MSTVKYTITKFDKDLKLITVVFEDGGWADIGLTNPLPKNISELENIIKKFTAPKEAIEAQLNPDADLSYIDSIIGIQKECNRLELNSTTPTPSVDPEVDANMKMWEEVQFQRQVGDALVKFGMLEVNPTTIPTATL